MIETIKRLMKGDKTVADSFKKADGFWKHFFEVHGHESSEADLARALGNSQLQFEMMLDMNRAFAKSMMPITCLAALYQERIGFDENRRLAIKVVNAFRQSLVSGEVKGGYLREAVMLFHLDEEVDLKAA
jgi:hypothetical protein